MSKIPDMDLGNQVIDLFDDDCDVDSTDRKIGEFLKSNAEQSGRLVVFYIGHGHVSEENRLCLFLSGTDSERIDLTSYKVRNLGNTIYQYGSQLSTLVVLDCCWAATAATDLQPQGENNLDTAIESSFVPPEGQVVPGLAILCASSSDRPALSPDNSSGKSTKFGEALLWVLLNGMDIGKKSLSAFHLQAGTKKYIESQGDQRVPPPEVHCPRGQGEGIGEVDFFPNLHSFAGLSTLEKYALQHQLEDTQNQLEDTQREASELRCQLRDLEQRASSAATRQKEARETTIVNKGFFAPRFLNSVIENTRETLDIVVGRARLFNYDTFTEIRKLCADGVAVRCFSLSENASAVTLQDAIQTVAPDAPEDGKAYKAELKNLNTSVRRDVEKWDPVERNNIGYYTYKDIPRVTLIKSDNTILLGFLTLFNETHEEVRQRPYIKVPVDTVFGRVLMAHVETLLKKDTTSLLVGDLDLERE